MAYKLAVPLGYQFEDANGAPLVGGTLEFYVTGTSTPTPIFFDSAGSASATTVTLNSVGMPQTSGGTAVALYFSESVTYKCILKDAEGTQVGPTHDPFNVSDGLFSTPESYGAAGDNSTDDETAFTNALTAGEVWLTPGKTYYVSNLTLPSGSVIYFNGATIRGGLTGGAGYKLIGPGTVTSNEGDGRPFTGHNSSGHYCRDITYCYAGTTGVDAVVYFAPESNLVDDIEMIRPTVCCDNPTENANTRGLKFYNREANDGRCQRIRVIAPHIYDCPSMGLEIVSEWTYDGATLGHQDVLIENPTIDDCGQNSGSHSKIGMSLAGWGRAKVVNSTFKNANGKNWELVSQNGSEVINCTIEDTASGFDIFSTSAPGAAPSAVNVKCRIDGVRVLDGNSQLMQVAGYEDGEIANIDTVDSSRLDLGCYRTRVHDNIIRCSSSGNIACRVTGGNNEIYDNEFNILAIGASGAAALRFNGSTATDNVARNNKLIMDSSVTAWDEQSSAADNIVVSYIDGDEVVHDTSYVAYTMSDADEDLSKAAQHADVLRIAGTLTATRTLTFTLAKNQDIKIWNATGQSITVGYSAGTTVTIPTGNVVHVMGNTGGMWQVT